MASPAPGGDPASASDAVLPKSDAVLPKHDPGKPQDSAEAGQALFQIGPLDVLVIKVWNNANLSGVVDVRSDGMISMPLIGEIKADGLTVMQLKDEVSRRLASLLKSPEVDIQVARVNSKKYYVYGGVARAGEFPLMSSMTIMDALSNTGGFRDFAKLKKIYLLRGTQKFSFNYKEVSQGKRMEQNIRIQNGDRIFVPE